MGESSTLANEVDEVMAKMDPNDLEDIVSDDDEEEQIGNGHSSDGK